MSAQLPLVSIIIPTYNMRQWIAEAIDSALAQTYPRVEVIVVDDGSTDGTGEFLREKYGDRIRYVYQENKGRGAARNHGLRLVRGEYIQFLDADDILLPDKVASHVHFLEENPRYAAVYGRVVKFLDGHPAQTWERYSESDYYSGNLLYQEIHKPVLLIMTMVRREWIEYVNGFDETLPRREDWDLWLRIAHAGGHFAYLPGPVVAMHRIYSYNHMRSIAHSSGVKVLRKLNQTISNPAERRRLNLNMAIGKELFGYGKALTQEGVRWKGIRYMLEGLLRDWRSARYKVLSIVLAMALPPTKAEHLLTRLHAVKVSLR